MKYFPYLVVGLFLLSSFTTFGMGKEPIGNQEILHLHFLEPILIKHESYIDVNVEGANARLYHARQPILPVYTTTMSFPFGTKILDVQCKTHEIKTMSLPEKITPAPDPIIRGIQTNSLGYKMDETVYTSDEFFPENWFSCYTGGGLDENNEHKTFLTIRVYPVRYSPATDTITYVEQLDITITHGEADKYPFPKSSIYDLVIITPLRFSHSLQKLVDHKNKFGVPTTTKTLHSIYNEYPGMDKPEQIKYFIKDAMENWGITYVLLVGGLKSIIAGRPRDNTNEGTRHWYLPVRYTNLRDNGSIYDPGFISDLYYADIYDGEGNFSSWDTNGDGVFGGWSNPSYQYIGDFSSGTLDTTDIIDFYPDVYVGRLPCRNILEVNIMVNKIIEYEQAPANPLWFNKMIVVGGDPYDDVGTGYLEGEIIGDKALSYLYDFEPIKLYASNRYTNPDFTPLTTNIIREITAGCGFLLFDGHASPGWWNTFWPNDFTQLIEDGGITIYDFPQLKNGQKLPICIVGGCHASLFNVSLLNTIIDRHNSRHMWSFGQAIPECWSWWLTRKIGGGSIATIGSTGLGYEAEGENGDLDGDGKNEPDCVEALGGYLETQFFKAYGNDSIDILGEAWGSAINQYLDIFPGMNNRSDAKTIEQWIIFGDPTLKIGGYPIITTSDQKSKIRK